MGKYLAGEFSKMLHRKYFYLTVAVLLGLETLLVILWSWMNGVGDGMSHITGPDGFTMILWMLSVGYFASILICDMVFSEQYKHNTLKNEVSFGLPRSRIYLGKLVVEALVSIVLCALVFLWYGVLCFFLLPGGGDWAAALGDVGFGILAALPAWMACLAFMHMLFFLMRGTTAAAMIAAVMVTMAGQLLQALAMMVDKGFLVLYRLLFTSPLDGIMDRLGDWPTVGWSWAVGGGWVLVTTAIGLTAFRKKEIS